MPCGHSLCCYWFALCYINVDISPHVCTAICSPQDNSYPIRNETMSYIIWSNGEGVRQKEVLGGRWRSAACVCGWRECWGMGCLYNEVRRGLFLTMEAMGGSFGLKLCHRRRRSRGAWGCCSGHCALVRSRYRRGGGENSRV